MHECKTDRPDGGLCCSIAGNVWYFKQCAAIKKQPIKNVEKAVENTKEKFYNRAYSAEESRMNQESWEYYNIAAWLKEKVNYNRISKFNATKHRKVLHGQIWYCDLGYNVGTEKNKMRPVLVISNNKINNSEKVVVVCITDARGKTNVNNLPVQDSWFLLYSDTEDEDKMLSPGRTVPNHMNTYNFLEKDSMVQCEEIRAVSKSRLDASRGCIGMLTPEDFKMIKEKFKRTYNL